MNRLTRSYTSAFAIGVASLAFGGAPSISAAAELGTAFSYQGHLENGSGPVGSPTPVSCDFRFGLWDAAAAGNQIGASPQTILAVEVSNGTFSTPIDFGAAAIDGTARWLEIEVQCAGDADFTMLLPRVELTPAPHARALAGLYTEENATSPNVIGGFSGNFVTSGVVGATIGGGGNATALNSVTDNYATIGGGISNTGGGYSSSVGGGALNAGSGIYSSIGGGDWNTASGAWSTVPGGSLNRAGGDFSFAAGRLANARDATSTGEDPSTCSFFATCGDEGTFVWADSTDADFVSTAPNQFLIRAGGGVGIGTNAPAAQLDVNGVTRTTALEITGGVSGFPSPLIGWGSNADGQTDVPAGKFSRVAAGGAHSVAIRWDGTLAAWGNNDFGQTDVPAGIFIDIAVGAAHSLAMRADGTLVGWGSDSAGQIDVPPGSYFAMAAAENYSLAIRNDGAFVVGWGDLPGPVPVPSSGDYFEQVAAGTSHCLTVKYNCLGFDCDGPILVGWGSNSYGEITIPPDAFYGVAAGNGYSVAHRNDGTLVAWGLNDVGQTDVPAGAVGQVFAGWDHGLAYAAGGTLVGWGNNDQGQLDIPQGTFATVAAGRQYSLGIKNGLPPSDPALLLHADSAFKPSSQWTTWSDRRLKKNIEPLGGALEDLLQLRGVTFQWRDPASLGGITGTQMGLIADEVAKVFPQWIGRDAKGYQTLTVGGFEALTAEALRELRAEKDRELKDKDLKIADLEARLAKLEAIAGTNQPVVSRTDSN